LGRSDDAARQATTADRMADRRADQADADQRYGIEVPAHRVPALRKSASAATTVRLSASVPIVIRSAFGKPYPATRRKMMPRVFRNSSAADALCAPLASKWIRMKLPTLGVTLRPS